jgi:hypothetical protein
MGPLWQDPQQATPASVNSKLSSRLAVFPRPQRIYINKFDRFNGIQGNSSSPGPQLSFVAEKTDGGRVPTGQEVIAIQRGKAPIEAAGTSLILQPSPQLILQVQRQDVILSHIYMSLFGSKLLRPQLYSSSVK